MVSDARLDNQVKLPFGLKNGRLVHISEIREEERGNKCGCICPECKKPLMAKLGDRRRHHFSHQSDCKYAIETALHLFAKEALEKHKKIKLPGFEIKSPDNRESLYIQKEQVITFDKVELEKRIDNIIPDVVLYKKEHKLIVEIKVTHGIDDDKKKKISDKKISTLQINLNKCNTDFYEFKKDEIENVIINDTQFKEWIHNEKFASKRTEAHEEWYKAEEKKKQKIQEHEEKKKQNKEKKILAKEQRIEPLVDMEYQVKQREKWAKNIVNNTIWKETSKRLNINLESLPEYLNVEIKDDFVFGCDRRVWQSWIYMTYVYNYRMHNERERYIEVRYIVEMLKRKGRFPLITDLIFLYDTKYSTHNGLAEVVDEYLSLLCSYTELERIKYTGNAYYSTYRFGKKGQTSEVISGYGFTAEQVMNEIYGDNEIVKARRRKTSSSREVAKLYAKYGVCKCCGKYTNDWCFYDGKNECICSECNRRNIKSNL